MSLQAHESIVETTTLSVVDEIAIEQRTTAAVSRRVAQGIASGGRFGAVWLPVYALVALQAPSLAAGIGYATAIAMVWFLAMRGAFAAARPTLLSLGPSLSAGLGTATGLVPVAAVAPWLPGLHLEAYRIAMMAAAVFVLSAAWEGLAYRSIAARQRVLIVGAGDGGSDLVDDLALADDLPFELVGIVDDERTGELVAGVPLRGTVADLDAVVRAERPDIVVLAVGERRPEAFDRLLDVAGQGFSVVGLPEFYEVAFGRVPVRHLSPAWFMSVLHLYQRPYSRVAKRAFDLVVGSIGLLLVAPLFPLLALLVRRTPGPAIFKQVRLGEGGRLFTIYKFRTMRVDAEAQGAVWASERDPRITALGRIMRKTRLDELPQLWNVIRGDMSIVGPRPERPEFMAELQETVPFWTRRHLVKPGITGLAQVCRGYTADAEGTAEKLSYDLWYLRHRSLFIGLAVCIKTFTTLVTGDGAR